MNIARGSYTNGASVIPYPSNQPQANEKWRLYVADEKNFQIVANENADLVVLPGNAGFTLQNKSDLTADSFWTLITQDGNVASGQTESGFLVVESGYYCLKNSDGQYLSYEGNDTADTPRFTLSSEPVLWYLEQSENCYAIRQKPYHRKALNVSQGKYENGNSVIQYPYSGTANECWEFGVFPNERKKVRHDGSQCGILVMAESQCTQKGARHVLPSLSYQLCKLV